MDATPLPPALRAAYELAVAGLAIRRLHMKKARVALAKAAHSARQAGIPALMAEVQSTSLLMDTPAARLIAPGENRLLHLDDVKSLYSFGGSRRRGRMPSYRARRPALWFH